MREPKLVSTWKIVTLTVVTLSLYVLVWYYRVNRELRDLGQRRDDELRGTRPGISLAAVTVGGLVIVPPYVS
jgi:membrane protein implicated in regulation of membrane protease activity